MHSVRLCFRVVVLIAPMLLFLFTLAVSTEAQVVRGISANDLSPESSTLHDSDPDGSAGGRVNGLAMAAGPQGVLYSASEWGGLFKSVDRGQTWVRVDSHLPVALWRVALDPHDSHRVLTTSFYDGRVDSKSGINLSTDGGVTWTHPPSGVPPKGFCKEPAYQRELTALGVVFEKQNPRNVFVGTKCGLAVSIDSGETWAYIDPTKEDPADAVWDVIVHNDGIVDICGDDGHARSPDRGKTWVAPHKLPSGQCSLAVSPYESNVLFEVVGRMVYESDDGGENWGPGVPMPNSQGRIPFLATNKKSNGDFDLWFGEAELYKVACHTPASGAPSVPRCPVTSWGQAYTRDRGAHDDAGQIIFDPDANEDACPVAFSSDGGVYLNTIIKDPDCQSPIWNQPKKSPHSLWFFGMDIVFDSTSGKEDIYFGNQDSGAFYGQFDTSGTAIWTNFDCCDSFARAVSQNAVVYNRCCFEAKEVRENQLFLADPGIINPKELSTYPKGVVPGWEPHVIEHLDDDSFILLTTAGVFKTPNIRAIPVHWDQLGANSYPSDVCKIMVSGAEHHPHSVFLQAGDCQGGRASKIYRLDEETRPARWVKIQSPANRSGFGVFAVGDDGKEFLAASFAAATNLPTMVLSRDGGQSWKPLGKLDSALTANGMFQYANQKGPTDFTGFDGYVQPSAVAIDPWNPDVMVAASIDAGVFVSSDRGASWGAIESSAGRTLPRVRQIRFGRMENRSVVYLGSQGAGIWRISWP